VQTLSVLAISGNPRRRTATTNEAKTDDFGKVSKRSNLW